MDAMQLNQGTGAALRMLVLTVGSPGRRWRVDEAAKVLAVPRNHLAKVVQRLQKLDLLKTTRGRNGGVEATERTPSTPVGDIVRALEGTGNVVNCDHPPCVFRHGNCRLRNALDKAQDAFIASLNMLSIEDLADRNPRTTLLEVGALLTRP